MHDGKPTGATGPMQPRPAGPEVVTLYPIRADGSFGAEFGPIVVDEPAPPPLPATMPAMSVSSSPVSPMPCAGCGTPLQARRGICLGCTKGMADAMLERLRGRITPEAFAEVEQVLLAPISKPS